MCVCVCVSDPLVEPLGEVGQSAALAADGGAALLLQFADLVQLEQVQPVSFLHGEKNLVSSQVPAAVEQRAHRNAKTLTVVPQYISLISGLECVFIYLFFSLTLYVLAQICELCTA